MHDGHDGLIQSRQSAVPATLFVAERKWQSLQARHRGHFLDAVDKQGCARVAQHKGEGSFRRGQSKMRCAIDDEKSAAAAAQESANFPNAWRADCASGTREAV